MTLTSLYSDENTISKSNRKDGIYEDPRPVSKKQRTCISSVGTQTEVALVTTTSVLGEPSKHGDKSATMGDAKSSSHADIVINMLTAGK